MARRNNPIIQLLDSAQEAKREARRHHLRAQELSARCAVLSAKSSGLPRGGGKGLEMTWAALCDERDLELRAIEVENAKYHQVERLIDTLPGRTHREVLRYRYLRGMGWARVQREMSRDGLCYSDRQLFRLHGEALEELRRTLKEVMPGGVSAPETPELLHPPADADQAT